MLISYVDVTFDSDIDLYIVYYAKHSALPLVKAETAAAISGHYWML